MRNVPGDIVFSLGGAENNFLFEYVWYLHAGPSSLMFNFFFLASYIAAFENSSHKK
jgi:hypothetical protein